MASKPINEIFPNSIVHKWVRQEDDNSYWMACSRCGEHLPRNEYNQESYTKYCPNCGERLYVDGEIVTKIPSGIYRHYKGRYYKVLGVGEHTENSGEYFVMYQALYGTYKTYVRPLEMFIQNVKDEEGGGAYVGPRFSRVFMEG